MNEASRADLTEALRAGASEFASQVLADAWEAARAEAAAILKERMVAALLDEAASQRRVLEPSRRVPAEAAAAHPGACVTGSGRPVEDQVPSGRAARATGSPMPRSRPEEIHDEGVYVYGIIGRDGDRASNLSGVEGSMTFPIRHDNLVAVASRLRPRGRQWGIGADGSFDLALVGPYLDEHERVLEQLVDGGGVLPMRFGVLYKSADAVVEYLAAEQDHLGAALRRLEDRAEWGLTIRQTDDAPEPLGRSADVPASDATQTGREYLTRRSRQIATEAQRSDERSWVAARIHASISQAADGAVTHRVREARRSRPHTVTVLRSSYLVDRGPQRTRRFQERITEELRRYAGLGLTGELTGPWPPYNFSGSETVEVGS